MTRINIIPPEELMDQHLIAEYRACPPRIADITTSEMVSLLRQVGRINIPPTGESNEVYSTTRSC